MKTTLTLILGMLITLGTTMAQDVPPTVGRSWSSVDGFESSITPLPARAGKTALADDITAHTTLYLGCTKFEGIWSAMVSKALTDYMAGGLVPHVGIPNVVDQYQTTDGSIGWYNHMYSESNPLFNAMRNAPPPLGGRMGNIPHLIIDIVSSGGEFSLAQVSTESNSSEGLLYEVLNFSRGEYGPLAFGFDSQGNRITSGSGTQKVRRLVFVMSPLLFNGGGTQAGLNEAKWWIWGHSPYSLSIKVLLDGISVAKRSIPVRRGDNVRLNITLEENHNRVRVTGEGLYIPYTLLVLDRLDPRYVRQSYEVTPFTQPVYVGVGSGQQQIFTLEEQK